MIGNLLRKIDFFSSGPQLTLKNETNLRTEIGGVFSLLILGLIIFFSYSFGNDVVFKRNPQILQNESRTVQPNKFTINRENFFLGFQLEYTNAKHIEEYQKLVRYKASMFNYTYNDDNYKEEEIHLKLVPCNTIYPDANENNKIVKALVENEMFSLLSDLMCPDNMENYFLEGTWDNSFISLIQIDVYKCLNDSAYLTFDLNNEEYHKLNEIKDFLYPKVKGDICLDGNEIDKKVTSQYFSIYSLDYTVDLKDFENPLKLKKFNKYQVLDKFLIKDDEFFIGSVNVTTDKGWLMEAFESEYEYKYTKIDTVYNTFSKEKNYYYKCWMYAGSNLKTYERSYLKVQDVVALLGGVLKFFNVFGFIIISPLNKKMVNVEIMSELFDFNSMEINSENNKTEDETKNKNLKNRYHEELKSNYNFYKNSSSHINPMMTINSNEFSEKIVTTECLTNSLKLFYKLKEEQRQIKLINSTISFKKLRY